MEVARNISIATIRIQAVHENFFPATYWRNKITSRAVKIKFKKNDRRVLGLSSIVFVDPKLRLYFWRWNPRNLVRFVKNLHLTWIATTIFIFDFDFVFKYHEKNLPQRDWDFFLITKIFTTILKFFNCNPIVPLSETYASTISTFLTIMLKKLSKKSLNGILYSWLSWYHDGFRTTRVCCFNPYGSHPIFALHFSYLLISFATCL